MTRFLLAIDPGLATGWAVFALGEGPGPEHLLGCGLTSIDKIGNDPFGGYDDGITKAIIESPKIYPGGRTKNPNDVLKVARNAGEWAGKFLCEGIPVEYVEPAQWKGGQTPKDIQHARDWAKLSCEEQEIVNAAGKGMPVSKRHNMLDAISIGLSRVKR